jgi:uncharacterized protein (TIRG00374 family)
MAKKRSFWYSITHQTTLNREEYLKLARRVAMFVGGGFAASLIVFIIIAWVGGLGQVIKVIASARLDIYALAFVAVLGSLLLRFVKWSYYMKLLKLKVPLGKSLAVYLSLYSMTITPGQVGRVVAAYTLNRLTKIKFAKIIPIVTMDIFTDFLGFGILALLAALYFHKYVLYITLIDIVLMLPFLFILNDWLYKIIKRALKKNSFLRNFTPYGEEYFRSQNLLNAPKVYFVSILVTLPAAFLNSLTLYFALLSLGIIAPISGTVFIYSSSTVFGMVSAVPGSIGVTDGSIVALLGGILHLAPAISSAVTIMGRTADLWFGVVLGAIFFFITLRYWAPQAKTGKKSPKSARL